MYRQYDACVWKWWSNLLKLISLEYQSGQFVWKMSTFAQWKGFKILKVGRKINVKIIEAKHQ